MYRDPLAGPTLSLKQCFMSSFQYEPYFVFSFFHFVIFIWEEKCYSCQPLPAVQWMITYFSRSNSMDDHILFT